MMAKKLEELLSRADHIRKKLTQKGEDGLLNIFLIHLLVRRFFQSITYLEHFEEATFRVVQHFLIATGKKLENSEQKKMMFVCQAHKLVTYLGFDPILKIARLTENIIDNVLRDNDNLKQNLCTGLIEKLQSNNDTVENAKFVLLLGESQVEMINEFNDFFLHELDALHESDALQKLESVDDKLCYIEQHLSSKFLEIPKMKTFLEKAKAKKNPIEYIISVMFQKIEKDDYNEFQVSECDSKCGYKFQRENLVVSPKEVNPAFGKWSSIFEVKQFRRMF